VDKKFTKKRMITMEPEKIQQVR